MKVKNSPSGLNSTYVQCAFCILWGEGRSITYYEQFGQIFPINS